MKQTPRTIHYFKAADGCAEAYSSKRAVLRAIAAKLKATYRVA